MEKLFTSNYLFLKTGTELYHKDQIFSYTHTHTPSIVRDSFLLWNYHFQCLSNPLHQAVFWPLSCCNLASIFFWASLVLVDTQDNHTQTKAEETGKQGFWVPVHSHTHQATENTCAEDCFIQKDKLQKAEEHFI